MSDEEPKGLSLRDRAKLADQLNSLDRSTILNDEEQCALLAEAASLHWNNHYSIGVTGPPGVGKSTLVAALAQRWQEQDLNVGILAVDPSSAISGGALLGDRIRMQFRGDNQPFIRSVASRSALGGLAEFIYPALLLFMTRFHRTLVETIGVGQTETDIASATDCTVLVLQPGSGDMIQFIKSGIMEIPDLIVINKSDLGDFAIRTRAEVIRAVRASDREIPVLTASCESGEGLSALLENLDAMCADRPPDGTEKLLVSWQIRWLQQETGRRGMAALGGYAEVASQLTAAWRQNHRLAAADLIQLKLNR